MIKAILFDLDNTLLNNPNSVFVPEYLRLADAFFFDDKPEAGGRGICIEAVVSQILVDFNGVEAVLLARESRIDGTQIR